MTDPQDVDRLKRVLWRLRDERFEKSGTQLARALGLSQSGISQLLSGRTTPSLGTLRRIAKLAGMSVGELLDGTEGEALPHRRQAADIARDGGLPEAAIQAVLDEDATEDAPILFWLKRIEGVAIMDSMGRKKH